jgi:uncharacterized protein YndB with AHSA1/START domain
MKVSKSVELHATPAAVWDALTQPEQTKQYFFGCEALSDWTVGSKLDYQCDFNGTKLTVVTGEILAIDPPRYLEVTCRGVQDGVEGSETIATYTLTATEGGTRLDITQGEFEDDASSGQHEASWDQVLGALKVFVE